MNWVIWAVFSALFAAVTALLAKVGIRNIDSNLATAVRTLVVFIVAAMVVLISGNTATLRDLSLKTWVFLTLSGVATCVSWLCYFKALQAGEAAKVASVDKLSVVFVILFAAIFLGEELSWKSALGGGLILTGAILVSLK
jgi:bacterial/archaeal transporter family protein